MSNSTPFANSAALPASCVVGASRGIGLEFVRVLLARGHRVIAAVRDPFNAGQIWPVAGKAPGICAIHQCDVTSETSIEAFINRVKEIPELSLDYLILNAGILQYPNRATEVTFQSFLDHLTTNTVGPIIVAQKLLSGLSKRIKKIVFVSSDSGSAVSFREFEDGFAAYAASKAALNQMLRHMAAEIRRREDRDHVENSQRTTVLAIHPGEVQTDMADIEVDWEVEGIIGVEESVRGVLDVIESKQPKDSGTFWTWDGREHPW